MAKSLYRSLLLVVIVLFCVAFIFSNSLKNAEESRADSDVIVEIVERVANKIAPDNELDWNYIVRKCAHLFEFFLLGIAVSLLYLVINIKRPFIWGFVFLFAAFIAFSDEFIQRFTGRGSRFSDMIIDFIGASIGIAFIILLNFIIKRRKDNSKCQSSH